MVEYSISITLPSIGEKMPFDIDSVGFLRLLITSPFLFFIVGWLLQKRGQKGGYYWQTVANAFFFLALGFLTVLIFLAIGGSWAWNTLFHEPLALVPWVSFLASTLIMLYLTRNDSSNVTITGYVGAFGCTLAVVSILTYIIILTMVPISGSFSAIIQSFTK